MTPTPPSYPPTPPRSRVIVYGQAPSRSSDPTRPLSGSSGRYFAELAGFRSIDALAEFFELRNLLPAYPGRRAKGDDFDAERARGAARVEMASWEVGDRIVFLGRNVAAAFGLDRRIAWFEWFRIGDELLDRTGVLLPHPSTINVLYNDPETRRRAAAVLRELVRGAKKEARS